MASADAEEGRLVVTLDTFKTHLLDTASGRTVLSYMADARAFEAFRSGRPANMDLYEEWVGTLAGLRPQTVWRKRAAVNRWLAYMTRHGDASSSVTLSVLQAGYRVGRQVQERDRSEVEPATEEEFRWVLNQAPEWGKQVASLLWWTGARVSEIVGDGVAGILALSVIQGEAMLQEGYTETFGKGGKRRRLILPSKGRQILVAWLSRPFLIRTGPLFPSPLDPSRALTARAVDAMLHRVGGKHAHAWRHAYKSRLRRAGVQDEIIHALMGHGPKTVTDRYGRVSVDEMRAAAERL